MSQVSLFWFVRTTQQSCPISILQGGFSPPPPPLCLVAIELWEWCFQRGIHLSAAHFPGVDFLVADFLFRGKFLPSEWSLNPLVFQRFYQVFSSLSGDWSVCVHHQFLTSQVLCPLQGSMGLEGGRTLLPVVRSSLYAFPPFSRSFPQFWRRSLRKERTWL